MRVLHLIDQASPEACPTTLALLRLTVERLPAPGHEHRVLAIGGAPLDWALHAAGLRAERVASPFGSAYTAVPALRSRLRGERFDLIHCWSPTASAAARWVRRQTPQVLTLTQAWGADARCGGGGFGPRSLARAIMVPGEARRESLVAAGVDARRVHAVPPAVDPGLLERARRAGLREAWGVDDATTVVALLSDPPTAGDALRADLGAGLAYETVKGGSAAPARILLLRHPGQHRRAQSRRMMDNYGAGGLVAQEPQLAAPWQVLPACDAAMSLGDRGGGLALRWAMAAGLPIVAECHPLQEEWLVADTTALLCDRDQIKRLAHRLHQVLRDRDLASRLGGAARHAAEADASPAAYAAAVRRVYEAAA